MVNSVPQDQFRYTFSTDRHCFANMDFAPLTVPLTE